MLKVRIIPILTYNGFGLVKTKKFASPRMVGNPVQSARVYNNRCVDELIFLDIFATKQSRKINLNLTKDIIDECFMPVGIGGGVQSIDDINDLLRIGADKVIMKTTPLQSISFIRESANHFGSQCISVSIDAYKAINGDYYIYNPIQPNLKVTEYIKRIEENEAGELILNSVDRDGTMSGFDIDLINLVLNNTSLPVVVVGGAGNLNHFNELFTSTSCEAVGCSSIFHFTQYTPLDIRNVIRTIPKNVRA